ncbi:MAG: carboxypeptidase-like regulatory domain-containing protein [Candidatus Eremiobacteraeota bacterium]|nr:carboxypeptidase-like regulatory domain-containing protein [Candidatus Eremiobacteraeota bacterium]
MMNVARAAAAALLLALPLAACNNDDALPPASSFTSVHGVVVDGATKKPLANATVILDTVLTQTTDAQGAFTFDKVPTGIVDYVVKAPGYTDVAASANADPGKPSELSVSMQQPTPP